MHDTAFMALWVLKDKKIMIVGGYHKTLFCKYVACLLQRNQK